MNEAALLKDAVARWLQPEEVHTLLHLLPRAKPCTALCPPPSTLGTTAATSPKGSDWTGGPDRH